jgi:PKD repeat protein
MTGPVLSTAWPDGQRGKLVVGDYARGTVGLFDLADPAARLAPLASGLLAVVDMEPAPGGGIAMVEAGFTASGVVPGRVWVLEPAGASQRPWPKPVATASGQTVSFDARALDADSTNLTYEWDFGDGTTGSGATPSHEYSKPGLYRATVTVSDGTETGSDTVPVAAGLLAPSVEISSPADGATVSGGQVIPLRGSATLEGQALPSSALSWTLVLHHGGHDHFLTSFNGSLGSVQIPQDHNINSSFDLVLKAKTSQGQSAYVRRSLHFKSQTLNLSTSVGAKVGWAGDSVSGSADTAVGLKSGLTVPAKVTVAGKRWKFSSWSDGSHSATRTFTMPDRDVSLRATYVRG